MSDDDVTGVTEPRVPSDWLPRCKKHGIPVGFHSRPGGTSVAVCESCGGECEVAMTTPEDKPKWPRAEEFIKRIEHSPVERWSCLLYGEMSDYHGPRHDGFCTALIQLALDAALAEAEKRIVELEAALTKRIQRDVIEFSETHKHPRYVDRITAERDELRAQAETLAGALDSWLAFEEDCIKRDGPYVSLKIPEQMTIARKALAEYRGTK